MPTIGKILGEEHLPQCGNVDGQEQSAIGNRARWRQWNQGLYVSVRSIFGGDADHCIVFFEMKGAVQHRLDSLGLAGLVGH